MPSVSWLKQNLEDEGVYFEEIHHPATYTAQDLAHMEHVSGHCVAKVVLIIADNKPIELVLPASRHVSLSLLKEILDAADVRLATEGELRSYFKDCELGAEPPMRHWPGVEVWMDVSLNYAGKDIVFQGGTHEDAIRMSLQDWKKLVKPREEAFAI